MRQKNVLSTLYECKQYTLDTNEHVDNGYTHMQCTRTEDNGYTHMQCTHTNGH